MMATPSMSEAATMSPVAEASAALQAVSISPQTPEKTIRSTSVKLSVPIDGPTAGTSTTVYGTRKLLRRDSMERREALLKGKEGSRQRRRWENDRLLSNPWAEPPLLSDWEVRPTYPVRAVPYYLAPLWDAAEFQRAVEAKLKGRKNSKTQASMPNGMSPMEEAATSIPKEIRAKLKHARSAKGLLQDLEEEVRKFVKKWNEREAKLRDEGLHDMPLMSDTEDEEIVFIGRNGAMHDSPGRKELQREDGWDETISREKLVFEGLQDDKGASFARWLVHCVGAYYGLRTWSVSDEDKRKAYVSVDSRARGFMGRGRECGSEVELPRPLWGMV